MMLGIVTIITALLLTFLLLFFVLIKKYSTHENALYWRKASVTAFLGTSVLIFLSYKNRYIYLFTIIFLFFLSAYNTPKALKSVNGYIVVGLYLGFWISLPLSLYFSFTK